MLVAKRLTDSDVTYGRIILPRVAVEANLKFVLGFRCVMRRLLALLLFHYASVFLNTSLPRSHNLPVEDVDGKPWEFVIKSWANGNEKRRVYALEQVC